MDAGRNKEEHASVPSAADERVHPPTSRESRIQTAALAVLAALGVVMLLRLAQEVFVPVVLAILISYALEPVVQWAMRFLKSRALAAALLLVLVVSATGFGLYSMRFQAADFVESLPKAAQMVRQKLRSDQSNEGMLEKVKKAANEIEETAAAAAGTESAPDAQPVFRVRDYLWWGSKGLLTFAGQVAIVLFLVYFILATGDLYRRKLVKLAGPGFSEKRLTVQIIAEIDRQIERFLLVQVLSSILVGVLTGVVLHWIGIRNAAIWGVLAAVLNPIPYLGPILVSVGVGVISFLQSGSLLLVLYAAGATILITGIEGMLVAPILIGKAASINQVAVFLGLLGWGWIWGAWGAVLAVPVLVVIKSICDRIEELQPIGELLSEK